jgi:hypothetical protein
LNTALEFNVHRAYNKTVYRVGVKDKNEQIENEYKFMVGLAESLNRQE